MSNLIRLEDVLAIIDKRTVKGKLQVAREVLKLPTIEPERKRGQWIPEFNGCLKVAHIGLSVLSVKESYQKFVMVGGIIVPNAVLI